MAMYANQKHIRLGHLSDIRARSNETEAFLPPVRWAPIKEAQRVLNGNAFKLWMYLLSWDGKNYYEFSPASLAKELKMSDEGARNARKELVEKGFLVEDGNIMEFYPISKNAVAPT